MVITGNFSSDIPKNKMLMMRTDNLKVKIFVNNNKVFSFGEEGTYTEFSKSPGNCWNSFVSPGISKEDSIRVELYNVYTDHVEFTFDSFLDNLYVGYESILIVDNIRVNFLNYLISIFLICLGVIVSILSYILFKMKRSMLKLICFSGLSISTGIWGFIDFNLQGYFTPYLVFNNSIDILALLFMIFFSLSYYALFLTGIRKNILLGLAQVILIFITYSTIMQVVGSNDYYDYLKFIQIICGIFSIIILICTVYEARVFKEKEIIKLSIYSVILLIGVLADTICNLTEIMPYAIWFRLSFVIFLSIQFIRILRDIKNIIIKNAKLEVLREMAYKDALTGINNRRAYLEKVEMLKSNLSRTSRVSIIVLDVNNLKKVNDTLGHEAGDKLIIDSCNIISNVFNKNDVYRIGGDEIVVILENIHEYKVDKLIDKFIYEIEEFNLLNNRKVSIAYGMSSYDNENENDKSFEEVFSRADDEMYKNKVKLKKKL
ncbi:Probable diguanylate cyclase YcdT [uncultured Clostridium sp.]|uniref:GGDEF domain-containing protein n=1 Tax=uncultured Clostridium sp. TaxID=59620 RepID=UPI0008212C09|nr:GGDEF domain-containing protein [uncultured Clostridium sp.]SCJ93693.1 Probable diguanylate cyclase YcdT [uncultured Clostridium sp.]